MKTSWQVAINRLEFRRRSTADDFPVSRGRFYVLAGGVRMVERRVALHKVYKIPRRTEPGPGER